MECYNLVKKCFPIIRLRLHHLWSSENWLLKSKAEAEELNQTQKCGYRPWSLLHPSTCVSRSGFHQIVNEASSQGGIGRVFIFVQFQFLGANPLTTPTSLRVWLGLFINSRIFLSICCHHFLSKCLSCLNKVVVFIVMFTGVLYSICTKPLSLRLLLQGWGLVQKKELFCNYIWELLKVYPWRYVFVCLISFKSSKWRIEGMYYKIFKTLLIYEINEDK